MNLEVGTAYQYKVRQQKAIEESNNCLSTSTDPYWIGLNLSVKDAVVKPISRQIAKEIIEEYEWLGCMSAVSKYYFGIFFDGVCGGVVVFGTEYSENLGIWDKYGFTGKILLLNRGVCLHWTPKNTGSKLIMEAIKQLPKQYEVITATTDHLAGEIGTLYQACNFYYVGSMRESNPKCKGKDRFGVLIDGKLYGSRAMRAKYGTQKQSVILDHHPNAEFIKQKSKHRYFLFNCNKRDKKKHITSIQHLIKEYPKRNSDELSQV